MLSRSQIQTISASVLATAASVVAIWVGPQVSMASGAEKIVATLLGGTALYAVYTVCFRFLRWLYYRKVSGEWYYVTLSESARKDQNYAAMTVGFTSEGTLRYKVDLYRNRDDLFNRRNSTGIANSEAMDYDKDREQLHVLYDVQKNDDPSMGEGHFSEPRRRGRLRLNLQDGALQGRWVSVFERREVSLGWMFAARPKEFARRVDAWIEKTRKEPNPHASAE